MRLLLVRHGQTDWNREGRFQGRMDVPLNETGRREARAVASRLAQIRLDRVISSPLSRALETAKAIAEANLSGPQVDVLDPLTEISHGEWEGLLCDQVMELWPKMLKLWREEPTKVRMPNGEDLFDVASRVRMALDRIMEDFKGDQTVCVVSHDAVIKVILCSLTEAPLDSFWRFIVPNASLSAAILGGPVPKVVLVGDRCHLGADISFSEQRGL